MENHLSAMPKNQIFELSPTLLSVGSHRRDSTHGHHHQVCEEFGAVRWLTLAQNFLHYNVTDCVARNQKLIAGKL